MTKTVEELEEEVRTLKSLLVNIIEWVVRNASSQIKSEDLKRMIEGFKRN